MQIKLSLALIAAAVAGSALAQQGMKPEDMIQTRQAGYKFMAWNMGKIKANLEGSYNKDVVLAAARSVAATANSGMGALYSPESGKDIGHVKTRVKPEFFEQPEEVKKVAVAYIREANELARVAESGDPAAVKVQFGKTGESCKGCHDKFRKDEK